MTENETEQDQRIYAVAWEVVMLEQQARMAADRAHLLREKLLDLTDHGPYVFAWGDTEVLLVTDGGEGQAMVRVVPCRQPPARKE